MAILNRLKSKVTIVSIVSQILAVLIALDVIDINVSQQINAVVIALLELLVTFGVLNNPSDKENF